MNIQFKKIIKENKKFISYIENLLNESYKDELSVSEIQNILINKNKITDIEFNCQKPEFLNWFSTKINYKNSVFYFDNFSCKKRGFKFCNVSKIFNEFRIEFGKEGNYINHMSNIFIVDLSLKSIKDNNSRYFNNLINFNQDFIDENFITFILMTKDFDISSLKGISINDFIFKELNKIEK